MISAEKTGRDIGSFEHISESDYHDIIVDALLKEIKSFNGGIYETCQNMTDVQGLCGVIWDINHGIRTPG